MTAAALQPSRAGDLPQLGDLFPPQVLCGVDTIEPRTDDLRPGERALVQGAVPRRVHEFAAGRRLARKLLARLGTGDAPLLRNPDRSPRWPTGVVGSLSHGAGLCVAVVARSGALAGLGVDVEEDEPLEPELWRRICTPRERERLLTADLESSGRRARLVFSAKEAVYKCVSAHARRMLGFHEVEVALDFARGRFAAVLPDDVRRRLPAGAVVSGAFSRRGPWILMGATLHTDVGPRDERRG